MSDSLRRFDIVVVEFPFVERAGARKRPALVLSDERHNRQTGAAIIAMITRASAPPWPGDVAIAHGAEAGLTKACKVRMKLHTVEAASLYAVGTLHEADQQAVARSLRECLAL